MAGGSWCRDGRCFLFCSDTLQDMKEFMDKSRNPDVLKVFRTLRGSFQAGAGSLSLPVLEVQAPLSCCSCCIRAEAHHLRRAALRDLLLRVWYGSLPASRLLPRMHDFYLGVEKNQK